ncbi:MAG: histidinol dehydrogenase [Planctomycetes bacterium]|nr:histidinol dehydrogenase [Planctomycetota bacterium]
MQKLPLCRTFLKAMTIRILKHDDLLDFEQIRQLQNRLRAGNLTARSSSEQSVPSVVRRIIQSVAYDGDDALIRLTAEFDDIWLSPALLRVSLDKIDEVHNRAEPAFLVLIRRVIDNVRRYQENIMSRAAPAIRRGGREMSIRYTPIDRVGVYVPGGKAFYPSTVLMAAVPAQVAGVREIAIASPPSCDGDINSMVLALAGELGITEIYRIGGAQAIAALAFGTKTVRAVDKIVGPGNAFVAEAKRQVFGRVGIDCIAGPSEVVVIADDSANAAWAASDLLAQAEHNPGSAILITPSQFLAGAVKSSLEEQAGKLLRASAVAEALENYCAIIAVRNIETACQLANDFAPEHLQIMTRDDQAVLKLIKHAGAIFLGHHTPVSLGDYYAGPSHVLPTGGTGRFSGPLSCNDFLKPTSIISYDCESLAEDSADVIDFATREGLTAHAEAVRVRLPKKDEKNAK